MYCLICRIAFSEEVDLIAQAKFRSTFRTVECDGGITPKTELPESEIAHEKLRAQAVKATKNPKP